MPKIVLTTLGLILYPLLAMAQLFGSVFAFPSRWLVASVLGLLALFLSFALLSQSISARFENVSLVLIAYLIGLVVTAIVILTGVRTPR